MTKQLAHCLTHAESSAIAVLADSPSIVRRATIKAVAKYGNRKDIAFFVGQIALSIAERQVRGEQEAIASFNRKQCNQYTYPVRSTRGAKGKARVALGGDCNDSNAEFSR